MLGPHNATLQVSTYRQGMASKAGHDLLLEVGQWEGSISADEGGEPALELSADSRSLEVREALHGVKPLSDKDRADIHKNIDDKVLRGQPIEFRSTGARPAAGDGRVSVHGELTMAGNSRPVSFELEVAPDGRVTGTASVMQSEWGIKPYSALMGALKVSDSVDVNLDAHLS